MNWEEIDQYARDSGKAVAQIAKEEGWTKEQLQIAWEYCKPFQKIIGEFVKNTPPEMMRMAFVLMIEALKAMLAGTTQVLFEAERGELNEEDLA